MAFESQIPRAKFIPTEKITLSDFSFQQIEVLDHLKASFNDMFDRSIAYEEFIVAEDTAGRLDLISWKAFQTVDYWWVIGYYNGIINPLYEVTPGRVLKIPSRNDVDFSLQAGLQRQVGSGLNVQRVIDIP